MRFVLNNEFSIPVPAPVGAEAGTGTEKEDVFAELDRNGLPLRNAECVI
jgi:hypothetical protein